MEPFVLFNDVKQSVKGYRHFLTDKGSKRIDSFEDIPITTKQNYLLKYKTKQLIRSGDFDKCFLIGSSSGFSKTGAVFWPKESVNEKVYLESIEAKLKEYYGIDEKKTLIIVSLALGLWIGGIQIACSMRSLAAKTKYPLTVAIVGLDIKGAVEIIKEFGRNYEQILIMTNPSNVNIYYSLFTKEKIYLNGKVAFPVVGEYFTEKEREQFAQKFGYKKDYPFILWTGYGSADTGDLGMETPQTIALRKYLYNNDRIRRILFGKIDDTPMIFEKSSDSYIETVDGNIVVTKNQLIPLIRYDTKDKGGVIKKDILKKAGVDKTVVNTLPDSILYVFGRTDDAVVFYGTNLTVSSIKDFLKSLDKSYSYAGLFELESAKTKDGVDMFNFTIYIEKDGTEDLSRCYQKALIDFLKSNSKEFKAKYDNLSVAVGMDLINIKLKSIYDKDINTKHRYLK